MSDKFFAIVLFTLCFLLILAPREYPRKIRHAILMPINMKMWAKEGRLHAIIHKFLWQGGNGH